MADRRAGYDVFISYSRKNLKQVAMIRDRLQALGLSVFFDTEGIEGGAEFTEVIDRAVKSAKAVLACWTHEALERRWVRIESRIGLDRGSLVATAIEPMTHGDLPAEFYNVNVIDLTGFRGQDNHPGWQGVLRAIGRKTGRADLIGSAGDTPLVGRGRSRSRWKGKAIAALVALGLIGAGGWYAAERMGLIGADIAETALTPEAVADRFEAQIARAEPILRAGAEGRIAEISREPFPRSVWATAQLVATAPDLPAGMRARYEETIEDVLDGGCHCVVIDGAPLTIVSGWIVLSFTEAGRSPPRDALTALIEAQNPRGWWSSALDADDQASNASLYVTAFTAFALGRALELMPASRGDRVEVEEARRRAMTWLRTLRPSAEGLWSDYPDNAQRNENIVFSAMMTILLLQNAEGAEAARVASDYLASLEAVSAPDRNFSYDTLVTQEDGDPYVDTFRHLPMGWETHALALAYRHLPEADRRRALELLRAASEHALDSPNLARQEWIVAEAVFGLRFAVEALRGIERL